RSPSEGVVFAAGRRAHDRRMPRDPDLKSVQHLVDAEHRIKQGMERLSRMSALVERARAAGANVETGEEILVAMEACLLEIAESRDTTVRALRNTTVY